MKQKGAAMIKDTWESVSQLWHPDLKNVAGPYDRSYGFDMNRYVSILALNLWTIIGKSASSIIDKPFVMSHSADFAIAPLIAILADYHKTLIPIDSLSRLSNFSGEHNFTSSTFSPPFDVYPRNITSWLTHNLTIGSESFNETVIGGPAESTDSFRPAIIHWQTGNGIGWIAWQATEPALTAVTTPGQLNLTYPHGTSASVFTLLVSSFNTAPFALGKKREISSWDDVVGLSVKVSGNVNMTYALSFAGTYGGADTVINDFEFWNFTYSMRYGEEKIPNLMLNVELI